MRIAYIAPYQGPLLLKTRPVIRNLSLAASIKIELIAKLLSEYNHEVEIISQGEVVELTCKWYPPFRESVPFDPKIPVFYPSALPIRFLNGLWSSRHTLDLFKSRHQRSPYDLVIIYNLKPPQVVSADFAICRLGLPVIFEYEDDAFVDLAGRSTVKPGVLSRVVGHDASRLLPAFSGCMAVSPHLLSQLPPNIPKLLMRGVVGNDIVDLRERMREGKRNWVLYAGTFHRVKGLKQLIRAWELLNVPDWELHIAGDGDLAMTLREMARNNRSIVFHGLLDRHGHELVNLMCSAKVCINPHDVSQTPGNIFSFKIIEYLAAGAHVISTPMGDLEDGIESGMTYMHDNDPATIAVTLQKVIAASEWRRTAAEYVLSRYSAPNIAKALDEFTQQVMVEAVKKRTTPTAN